MGQDPGQSEAPAALVLLEEAVHLLRQTPKGLLATYYIGVLPFLLGTLYFWTDMSCSAFAASRLPGQAMLLAVLFVWMKCWQCIFMQGLLSRLCAQPAREWRWRDLARLTVRQSAIQGPGLCLLGLASIVAIPLPWTCAFYQNFTLLGHGRDNQTLRQGLRASWQQASLWPKQNIQAQVIVLGLALFIFVNIIVCLLAPAYLLKTYLATETVFSRGGFSPMNSTFLMTTAALTFLCLDPLVKAFYVLRCFYGHSLQTGQDLLADMSRLEPPTRKLPAACLLAVLLLVPAGAYAAPPSTPPVNAAGRVTKPLGGELAALLCEVVRYAARVEPVANNTAENPQPTPSARALDQSIADVLARREYAWRLPREQAPQEENSVAKYVRGLADDVATWLSRFRRTEPDKDENSPAYKTPHIGDAGIRVIKIFLFVLLALMAVLIVVCIVMAILRRRRAAQPRLVTPAPAPAPVDLASEDVTASDRTEAGWMELAAQMMSQGDRRLALRAMFLACMSLLGERGLILIRRFKSNREYVHELGRRRHVALDLPDVFGQSVLIFEDVWYGLHEPTDGLIENFARNQERIRQIAST